MSKRLEKGRVKKVMLKDDDEAARKALQLEKRLREIAHNMRVIKLSNAARAAQTKGEEGSRVLDTRELWGLRRWRRKV